MSEGGRRAVRRTVRATLPENTSNRYGSRTGKRPAVTFWFRHWNPRPAKCGQHSTGSPAISSRRALPSTGSSSGATVAHMPRQRNVIAIARDNDTTFGILHSRFHELWSLRLWAPGSGWKHRPALHAHHDLRDVPVSRGDDARRTRRRLRRTTRAPPPSPMPPAAWSSCATAGSTRPNGWSGSTNPSPATPSAPSQPPTADLQQLKRRTLTNLYNQRPQWLANAHADPRHRRSQRLRLAHRHLRRRRPAGAV